MYPYVYFVPLHIFSHLRFFQRAVVDGKAFPIGEGRNKKAARQDAAKNALRALSDKENPGPVVRLLFIFVKMVHVGLCVCTEHVTFICALPDRW